MAVGLGITLLKRCLDLLVESFRRQCLVRLQIDSRDDAYRWLIHWLSVHPCATHSRNLSVSTSLLAFGATVPGVTASESGVGILVPPRCHHVTTILPPFYHCDPAHR
jgi:hypothetical protein